MLLAGDEFGQTQHGNNNAYCQDSPVAWLDWNWREEQRDLFEFTRDLLQLRKTEPVFRRRHFFQGRAIHGPQNKDLYWLKAEGTEMSDADWNAGQVRTVAMVLPGDQITETDQYGQRVVGRTFALLLNADHVPVPFRLGMRQRDLAWRCIFDTADARVSPRLFEHMSTLPLHPRSFVLLQAEGTSV